MRINKELEQILLKVQKPARYTGGELNSVMKRKEEVAIRFAFCFPDTYEVGMSHLGMKLLYGLFNEQPDVWCERVFAPDVDMEALMRENGVKLYGLESRDPIGTFDFLGFTLQYELSFTAILNMLDLAGLPLRSADRGDGCPLVIAGGPCACNPEPIADFIDLFTLGEGEEVNLELFGLYRRHKAAGFRKAAFLREAAQIEGVYVPSLYDVQYHEDGTVASVTPRDGAREGAQTDSRGHGRRVLSRPVCGPLYRYRTRPGDERDFPGLYPGLPVLSGRVHLPAGAGEIARDYQRPEPRAL